VSSKATLRIGLNSLLPLIPSLLHQQLRQSRYYAPNSDSIVIQADDSRKQADNAHHCFVKLNSLISEAAEQMIPGETSDEQKQRVQNLSESWI
jgi:peptidyl-tRNA hydrolase ICT1